MRLRASLAAVVALVLVTVAAPQANGGGGTAITTCGQTVTTNAVLTQDLVCTGSGVMVGASGITIDLKGFTLRGDRGLGETGIDDSAGYVRVTMKNGVVRNFGYGVLASSSVNPSNIPDDVTVSNLLASGYRSSALFIGGARASVKSSAAFGNNNVGIFISGNFARIQASTTSGNDQGGIQIDGSGARIQSSTASGNDGVMAFTSPEMQP